MIINKRNIMICIFCVAIADLSAIISLSALFKTKGTEEIPLNKNSTVAVSFSDVKKAGSKETISIQPNIVSEDADKSKIDKTMLSMYQSLLVGHYEAGSGISYNFLADGTFSGYFDDKHQMVKGYTYEVGSTGGNNIVNIYNKERSAVVSYYILLSDDADIILYYPEADVKIPLQE